ncbi:hypothetical protein WR25_09219 [Diploscapter pachys]|uniref:Uncharacterized protein n=1 Tax=Diploscapter pachys TaxID=2018661 RepID=A0A2A2KUB3_9BILA|nr:hypothetical protein WR25_09219 [Diploscapter pachys]
MLLQNEELLQSGYNLETKELRDEVDILKRDIFHLRLENNDLIAEKQDLQKDCKIFRQTIAKHEVERISETPSASDNTPFTPTTATKSDRVSQDQLIKYEKLLAEYKQMQNDLHTVLGVKEELIIERDELVKKVDRLTTEMSFLLNGDPRRAAEDLDSLLAENRFLKAQLNTAQEESENIKNTLAKYKMIAESLPSKVPSPSRSQVSSLDEKNSVAVINMKQIRELLASQSIQLDDSDFRAITAILLDLCNDKQIALTHLRRANKSVNKYMSIIGIECSEIDWLKSNRNCNLANNDCHVAHHLEFLIVQ